MSTFSADALLAALTRELPAACAAIFGGTATVADTAPANGDGWAASVSLSGAVSGRIVVWLDAQSAAVCAMRSPSGGGQVGDDVVTAALSTLMTRLMSAVGTTPALAGVTVHGTTVTRSASPAGATAAAVAFDDGVTVSFQLGVEQRPATVASDAVESIADSRLEAVLEVDLPLVVRFGRAVMPLRSVAELSPGAVVDMGRTPDEPVELLVGERLVARGEVVIVGGNYGVRITEITSGRRSSDLEARP